jgi:hypothetical protein
MIKRIVQAVVVVAAMVGVVGVLHATSADAIVVPTVDKVDICHRDNNVNQPYGPKKINVSVSSITTHNNGHDDHNGPVASSLSIAQALKTNNKKWGDIIPPFTYQFGKFTFSYPGKNWDADGIAIWNHDCQYVVAPEGMSMYALDCEKITLTAPTGVKPADADYQYYIDGTAASLGAHSVSVGGHVITLKVNDVLVDTDEVSVEKCKEHPKPCDWNKSDELSKSDKVDWNKGKWCPKPCHHHEQHGTFNVSVQTDDNKDKWCHPMPCEPQPPVIYLRGMMGNHEDKDCKAVITVSVVCDQATQSAVVTLTNTGNKSGTANVNGEDVVVPAQMNGTPGTATKNVYTAVYDSALVCVQGQGSQGGSTGGKGSTTTSGVASLPLTSGSADQVAAIVVMGLTTVLSAGAFIARRRLLGSLSV